jgi:DNA-binding NtrC family response regulator
VREGRFREDLYYRLNVVALRIPPCERRENIPLLAPYFLNRAAKRHGRAVPTLSPEAMTLFLEHQRPGNVRELENAIERAVLLAETDSILPGDLPPRLQGALGGGDGPNATGKPHRLDEVEREHILRTFDACAWNQARASEALGIGRNTLWRKLTDYGVAPPERHRDPK